MSLENLNNIAIDVRNLSKKFGTFEALSDVTLQIKVGSIHAVIGENGAGKTTLLKSIFGLHRPTSGEVLVHGKAVNFKNPQQAIRYGIGMVQQHFTLVDELSAIDNIILGAEETTLGQINRKKAIDQIELLIPDGFLSVPWNELVGNLSIGQKQKIEILKLLYRNSSILFLDEPTAVLTPHEIDDFFAVLRKLSMQGKTIVIITHKINEVFDLCDELTVLRSGKSVVTRKVSKSSFDEIVESMIGRKPQALPADRTPSESINAICFKSLSETKIGRNSIKDVSFHVKKGEIVGIAGVEGSGQTQLIEMLIGVRHYSGKIELFGNDLSLQSTAMSRSQFGLVPEDRTRNGLWLQETGFHNLVIGLESKFSIGGWLNEHDIQSRARQWTETLNIDPKFFYNNVSSLSGGGQQKLIFARESYGRDSELLICHHPTRGVDLGAIEAIHLELLRLRNLGRSLLIISSELEELIALSDRIVVMFEGKTVKEFERSEFDPLAIGRYMTGIQQ